MDNVEFQIKALVNIAYQTYVNQAKVFHEKLIYIRVHRSYATMQIKKWCTFYYFYIAVILLS